MEGKKAKTLLFPSIKKPITAKCLPFQYTQNFRPSSVSQLAKLSSSFMKIGTKSTIVSLPKMNYSQDAIIKSRAMEQRNELLDLLETSNLTPREILLKVSQCVTPYQNLLKLAYDEFQYATKPNHSQQLDELERNAAVTSAKQEVEVQQHVDRVARLKNEGNDLRKDLRRYQNRLNSINADIERLNRLASLHGVDVEDKSKKTKVDDIFDDIKTNEPIPLDDEQYKRLWASHTKLLDEIEELENNLKNTQAKQLEAFHETAARIVNARGKQLF